MSSVPGGELASPRRGQAPRRPALLTALAARARLVTDIHARHIGRVVGRSYRRLIGLLVCASALSACGGSDRDSATSEPRLPTTHDGQLDLSGGPWRVIEVPAA